nr:uncharacterized protein LOC117863176 isoform X2 [Setaria viridis]
MLTNVNIGNSIELQQYSVRNDGGEVFRQRVEPYMNQILMYEDPVRQEAARKTVPIHELEEKALASLAKPIVKLLSPVLSLPTPNKAANQCGLSHSSVSASKVEGVNTHLYCFSVEHGNDNLKSFVCSEQCGPSLLDTILLSQWDNFAWKGHLDYDVTACQLKVIQIKAMVFLILISYWFFFYHANIDKP